MSESGAFDKIINITAVNAKFFDINLAYVSVQQKILTAQLLIFNKSKLFINYYYFICC
jgi:hypothetical protein